MSQVAVRCTGIVSRKTALILNFTRIIGWCCCCRHVGWLFWSSTFREASSKGGVFVGFEKHIRLFIRLIRTSLREPLSLVLPCSIGAGTRGRARSECAAMIASLYGFVCCCMFPPLGCIVCVFLQPLQTIQTLFPTKKLHMFILFFTPFSV